MFQLNPKLSADTFPVGSLTLSRVLLMNNHRYPWVILVPERNGLVELTDLSLSERIMLMSEICMVSELLKELYACDKLNVANLGNVVSQLHVHVIVRSRTDSAWPEPVWGKDSIPYTHDEQLATIEKLRNGLARYDEFSAVA